MNLWVWRERKPHAHEVGVASFQYWGGAKETDII